MLITEPTLSELLLQKRKSLKLPVLQLARLLNLKSENIYKWQQGTRPLDISHIRKLEMFIGGKFDKFVKEGKVSKDYNYETAIKELYPTNPTNDFVDKNKLSDIRHEQNNYLSPEQQIKLLLEINESKDQKILQLTIELEECKSKVVSIGKTGG